MFRLKEILSQDVAKFEKEQPDLKFEVAEDVAEVINAPFVQSQVSHLTTHL